MFHGSLVALVTPMLENGDIDLEALSHLTHWHRDNHTDGLVILGTTGESATITPKERETVIKQVVSDVNGKLPVIVGTGANATQHALEMTRHAMEWGADAALIVTPYYNKPTQEGLYQHYKAIAQAVPIPQILYNVPSRTACDLLPETVGRLAAHANIIAIKDATGDLDRLHALLALDAELDLYSGDDSTAVEFMLQGGKGVISVAANVVPQACHDLCAAALAGDRERAEKLNAFLSPLYTALMVESNPIPTKWALAQMNKIQSGIRLPLTRLSESCHAGLRDALRSVDISL